MRDTRNFAESSSLNLDRVTLAELRKINTSLNAFVTSNRLMIYDKATIIRAQPKILNISAFYKLPKYYKPFPISIIPFTEEELLLYKIYYQNNPYPSIYKVNYIVNPKSVKTAMPLLDFFSNIRYDGILESLLRIGTNHTVISYYNKRNGMYYNVSNRVLLRRKSMAGIVTVQKKYFTIDVMVKLSDDWRADRGLLDPLFSFLQDIYHEVYEVIKTHKNNDYDPIKAFPHTVFQSSFAFKTETAEDYLKTHTIEEVIDKYIALFEKLVIKF